MAQFADSSTYSTEAVDSFMRFLAHSMDETFFGCIWRGVFFPCNELFTNVKTDAGRYY